MFLAVSKLEPHVREGRWTRGKSSHIVRLSFLCAGFVEKLPAGMNTAGLQNPEDGSETLRLGDVSTRY